MSVCVCVCVCWLNFKPSARPGWESACWQSESPSLHREGSSGSSSSWAPWSSWTSTPLWNGRTHTWNTHVELCVCACLHVRVSIVNIISYRWISLLTVVQYDQQRGEQVTHPLDIANVQMLPNITVEMKSYWYFYVFTAFKYTPKLYHGVFLLFCALWFESEIDRKVWEMGRTCSKGARAGIKPGSLGLGLYCNDTPSAQWATRVPHMGTF